MNTPETPLVHKLTLLVLSLILACLVVLVVRTSPTPVRDQDTAPVAQLEPAPLTAEEAEPLEAATPQAAVARPPRRAASTNSVRGAVPSQKSSVPVVAAAEPSSDLAQQGPATSALLVNAALSEMEEGGAAASEGATSPGVGPELIGLVTLLGKPKPEIPIDLGPTCSRHNPQRITTRHYLAGPAGGLANVFVYLKDARRTTPLTEGPLLDQIGCLYEPYVMGVVAGQTFAIRNSDPELHNVHATPRLNREFNFGQPLQNQVNQRSFTKPEVFVRLKCDIHPWMFAYIGVVDHPFFAVTDTNGFFRLPAGIPAGTYIVAANHLKSGELTQKVSVHEGDRKMLQFQFSVQPNVQSQSRVVSAN